MAAFAALERGNSCRQPHSTSPHSPKAGPKRSPMRCSGSSATVSCFTQIPFAYCSIYRVRFAWLGIVFSGLTRVQVNMSHKALLPTCCLLPLEDASDVTRIAIGSRASLQKIPPTLSFWGRFGRGSVAVVVSFG